MATLAKLSLCGRLQVTEVVCASMTVKRHQSNVPTQANYKRGTGGRSSFSGRVCTVFGASGMLGGPVVNRLGKIGSQVIIPYRKDPQFIRHLRLCGDLGQILFNTFSLKDDNSIKAVMQYSNLVINMITKNYETRNFSFEDIHVDGPRRMARIAKELGVERFIHLSDINAGRESSNLLEGGSKFLATKLAGEQAVLEEFPEATIIRLADVISQHDDFTSYYQKRDRVSKLYIPLNTDHIHRLKLWRGGTETYKAPIKDTDVTEGIMAIVNNPETAGNIYQFLGPRAYTLLDLVHFTLRCKGISNISLGSGLDSSLAKIKFKARLYERSMMKFGIPKPQITVDRMERETISNEIRTDMYTIEDLGITPENIEDYIQFLMRPHVDFKEYKQEMGVAFHPHRPESVSHAKMMAPYTRYLDVVE